MLVIGSVYDFATEAGDPGNIKKLEYTIVPATIPGGTIPLSEDGSFSFSFHTSGFSVPMVILVHTITASRRLEDPMLEHDTWYYYRVKPIEQENIASEIATTVPGRFAIVWVGGCDTSGNARGVAVAGSYVYIADGPEGLRVIRLSTQP